jgi:hypothetical protein
MKSETKQKYMEQANAEDGESGCESWNCWDCPHGIKKVCNSESARGYRRQFARNHLAEKGIDWQRPPRISAKPDAGVSQKAPEELQDEPWPGAFEISGISGTCKLIFSNMEGITRYCKDRYTWRRLTRAEALALVPEEQNPAGFSDCKDEWIEDEHMNITKVSLLLEIDGMQCVALLDGIDPTEICMAIGALYPKGKLKVIRLSDEFKLSMLEKGDLWTDASIKS